MKSVRSWPLSHSRFLTLTCEPTLPCSCADGSYVRLHSNSFTLTVNLHCPVVVQTALTYASFRVPLSCPLLVPLPVSTCSCPLWSELAFDLLTAQLSPASKMTTTQQTCSYVTPNLFLTIHKYLKKIVFIYLFVHCSKFKPRNG